MALAALFTFLGYQPLWADPSSKRVRNAGIDSTGTTFVSSNANISITSEFPGGRMNRCDQISDQKFSITIKPERNRINDSAWYAFRVDSIDQDEVTIRLNYVGGTHRYDPKVSRDGKTWKATPELVTRRHPLGREVELTIPLDGKPIWVAGQELLDDSALEDWTQQLSERAHVQRSVIGESVQGRPLHRIDITESENPDYVFIIARQHPPEVSGAIGMMHFVEAIASDTEISKQFRNRYSAVVVPMVNPDGVAHGHWRCNANGVDLNRDWAHFTQPETRAVVDQLLKCRKVQDNSDAGQRLSLFIDFHSTFDDVFYTNPQKSDLYPTGFTENWLGAIQGRFPKYAVQQVENHNADRSTSKAWVAGTLGVTAITYEFGDETDRKTIRSVATGAAEEMMRLLVDLPTETSKPERVAVKANAPANF
ncbi:murein peptide amidase A [Rubripirellula tenax]|uniref:Murein peptide amidase A n=1 Tax=Rubripirellula tenax TaxID=2528015 RepID=A0A5C6F5Y0_9BACT|nr:murein peptide amidase A [Rubripirellula tenax]